MARVGIIGAGAMGLAVAYHASKAGHEVEVFEADEVSGGMAAHFDFGGLNIERFYHFVCKDDHSTFELMNELGIGDKMRWVNTKMGYYIDGKLYSWGDPISLLRFPLMNFFEKIRYALVVYHQTRQTDFNHLEDISVTNWIIHSFGQKSYDLMWKRLLDLKFYEYVNTISAAWMATRIKRVGNSRRSIFQESLGYIDGGSQTLVTALVKAIKNHGGTIHLSSPVNEVISEHRQIRGIRSSGKFYPFNTVISTVPTPLVSAMIPSLRDTEKAAYNAIKNIGVVCVLLKLAKPVSQKFWLNVNDKRMDIPGIVEFSNLRPICEKVVYVPYYMPVENWKFKCDDDTFVKEAFNYIQLINPKIKNNDLMDAHVGRLKYSQPICEPGFSRKIPPIQTSITGLFIADTCFYYPEDRGISESVKLAKQIVDSALALKP